MRSPATPSTWHSWEWWELKHMSSPITLSTWHFWEWSWTDTHECHPSHCQLDILGNDENWNKWFRPSHCQLDIFDYVESFRGKSTIWQQNCLNYTAFSSFFDHLNSLRNFVYNLQVQNFSKIYETHVLTPLQGREHLPWVLCQQPMADGCQQSMADGALPEGPSSHTGWTFLTML